jgi:DNA-binding response OmpR family regulator
MDGYLSKPINVKELLAVLRAVEERPRLDARPLFPGSACPDAPADLHSPG